MKQIDKVVEKGIGMVDGSIRIDKMILLSIDSLDMQSKNGVIMKVMLLHEVHDFLSKDKLIP